MSQLHSIPAKIEHNGEAPITSYFRPKDTTAQLDGVPVQEAAFRGRRLFGATQKLPEGFQGVILEALPLEADQKDKRWVAVGKFEALTAWKHDLVPSRMDQLRRSIDWLSLAKQINSPVSLEEFELEMRHEPTRRHL